MHKVLNYANKKSRINFMVHQTNDVMRLSCKA